MTKENAAKFFEVLKSDKELQRKLKLAMETFEGNKNDKEAILTEVIIPTAKNNSFDLTLDELKEYQPENGELDDEQLEAVSGGRSWWQVIIHGMFGVYYDD